MHKSRFQILTRLIFSILIFAVSGISPVLSQSSKFSSFASLAEKIYLQLDNNVYTNDQTIWFKSIVTDAIDFAPTILSGVLYVELVDENEKIVEKKLTRIEHGTGEGFFQLNKNFREGLYQVRAYTQWEKNFGPDFFFTKYIRVFAATDQPNKPAIKNITLVEGQNNQRRLTASFDPLAIDSLHTKDLTIFLSFDEKKDTLSVRKTQANGYLLDYAVPEGSQLITVQLQTKNNFIATRTILLDKDYLDLQFFPESGELVHGMPGMLGFKATDINGRGKLVEGDIINATGDVISHFKTNNLGMGTVMLPGLMDSSVKYLAKIVSASVNGPQKMYALPAVAGEGNILSIKKDGDKIRLKASSNYMMNDSVFIQVSCRGAVYFDIKGKFRIGTIGFELPADALPAGIINFTMMNDSMKPVAERLYFNERPESRINISIAADQPSYTQRELTKLAIETKNSEGQPVAANLSLAVVNKTQLGQLPDGSQHILSYFLLSSDLKGTVENPGYYFSQDTSRFDELDALLLTQGWRRYLYTREQGKIIYQPEPALTVSGTVKGGLFVQKQKKEIGLTMMSFGSATSVQTRISDSVGRFNFNVNNEYGQTMNVIIQSSNKSGAKKDYSITLDKKESPAVLFDHIKSAEEPDSVVKAYVKKNIERKKAEDAFKYATEGITLDEVILKSYPLTPERKKVIDQYGNPKFIIEGKAIRDKEAKWSYGLYSVLLFNFPDKVNIIRRSDGNLYAKLYNGEMTLVVIDGIPVRPDDYPIIPSIPPSEVSSFEIIEYAKNFSTLYCDLFPQSCINAPSWGNVIAIYTYGKKGIFGANRPVGIVNTTVPVFATPREFYAPKYEQLKPADWLKPDLRSLVHWAPNINSDSTGKATVNFYNADNTGVMQVLVEAITETGEIGYQEFYYDVKKRN